MQSNLRCRTKYVVPPYSISLRKKVFELGSQLVCLSWISPSEQPTSVRINVIPIGCPLGLVSCGSAFRASRPILLAFSRNSSGTSSPEMMRSWPSSVETAALLAMAYKNSPLNQKTLVSQWRTNPAMASCTMYSGQSACSSKYLLRMFGSASHSSTVSFRKPSENAIMDCFRTNVLQPRALICSSNATGLRCPLAAKIVGAMGTPASKQAFMYFDLM
mmetsp:Transcript_18773/g.44107  ORF Transcript_18773/g.44107 Transcript_18773/m.44107 type:complete len:217 (+) Transcript_18773:184-834(+)